MTESEKGQLLNKELDRIEQENQAHFDKQREIRGHHYNLKKAFYWVAPDLDGFRKFHADEDLPDNIQRDAIKEFTRIFLL